MWEKNKDTDDSQTAEDYVEVIERLGPSADYVVVNVSSPNTPGLRSLANDKEALRRIITLSCEARDKAVASKVQHRQHMRMLPKNHSEKRHRGSVAAPPPYLPLFIKISPDMTAAELDTLLDVVMSVRGSREGSNTNILSAIDGLVVCNSTTSRPEALQSAPAVIAQAGGLSGAPLRALSTQQVARVYLRTRGQIPIVGVGGISSGRDAFERVAAGASLVQIHSVLAFRGPGTVRRVKRELARVLLEEGYLCVEDAVGTRAAEAAGQGHHEERKQVEA